MDEQLGPCSIKIQAPINRNIADLHDLFKIVEKEKKHFRKFSWHVPHNLCGFVEKSKSISQRRGRTF